MLNVEMIERLAQPCGVSFDSARPIMLEDVFGHVASDGWAPRSPAYGAELDRLDVSVTRGDCLSPIIQDSDHVYVDRQARPRPGDIVAFEMSRRFVEAQNSALPPGQSPWSPGAPWLKLFVDYHGIEMLVERFGNAMTATFAACETPDDTPRMGVVRNIRRAGRLLFAPDIHTPQVGLNAASTIGSALSVGASSLVSTMPAHSGVTLTQTQVSLAVTTTGAPAAIDAAANVFYSLASGVTLTSLNLQLLRDGSAVAGGLWDFTAGSTYTITGGGNSPAQQVTMSCVDSPAAGSHTYSLLLSIRATGSAGGAGATTSQNYIKVREIKR